MHLRFSSCDVNGSPSSRALCFVASVPERGSCVRGVFFPALVDDNGEVQLVGECKQRSLCPNPTKITKIAFIVSSVFIQLEYCVRGLSSETCDDGEGAIEVVVIGSI